MTRSSGAPAAVVRSIHAGETHHSTRGPSGGDDVSGARERGSPRDGALLGSGEGRSPAGGQTACGLQLGAAQRLRAEGLKTQGVGGDGRDGAGQNSTSSGRITGRRPVRRRSGGPAPRRGRRSRPGADAAGQEPLGDAHAAGIQADERRWGVHAQDQLGGTAPEIDDEARCLSALALVLPSLALPHAIPQETLLKGQAGLPTADDPGALLQQPAHTGDEVLPIAGVSGGEVATKRRAARGDAQLGAVGGGRAATTVRGALEGSAEHAGAVHLRTQAHPLWWRSTSSRGRPIWSRSARR